MSEAKEAEETQAAEGADEATPRRRRLPIVPALIFLAIIGSAVFLLYIRSRPEQAVVRLVDYELKLAQAGLGEQMYDDTLSLATKQSCDRDEFIGAVQQTPEDFWKLTKYKDIHIKVEGNRAIVTYLITYNGVVVERATEADPDIYTKATKSSFGPLISVAEEVAKVEALNNAPGGSFFTGPKEYRDALKEARKKGNHRRVLEKAGQWYDAPDSHSRCG
jgi:hypothetical protein